MSRLNPSSHPQPGHPWPGGERGGLPFKAVHLDPLAPFVGIKLIDLLVNALRLA